MKSLNTDALSDLEYSIISDKEIIGGWVASHNVLTDTPFTIYDLKVDSEGNVYRPTNYEVSDSTERSAETGYNTADNSSFAFTDYEMLISAEEIKKEIERSIIEYATALPDVLRNKLSIEQETAKSLVIELLKDIEAYCKYV